MKKYLQLFFSLFLAWNFSFAQSLSIGIRAGVSHTGITGRFRYKSFTESQISYNNVKNNAKNTTVSGINTSGILKPTTGFILNYLFYRHISIQSEFNYEKKGFDYHCIHARESVYGNYKMHYVGIPISLNFEAGEGVKYYGYWGISLDILAKASNTVSYNAADSNSVMLFTYHGNYKATGLNKKELSALAGLGVKIPLSDKLKFALDMRYNSGMTKAARNTDVGIYFHPDMKSDGNTHNFQNVFNRSVTLCVEVLYNVHKKKDKQIQ
jgi:Outer membrane protein beta-barrel domain